MYTHYQSMVLSTHTTAGLPERGLVTNVEASLAEHLSSYDAGLLSVPTEPMAIVYILCTYPSAAQESLFCPPFPAAHT